MKEKKRADYREIEEDKNQIVLRAMEDNLLEATVKKIVG